MFVYTIKHKPLNAGRVKTEAYIDNQRRIDARFVVGGFQESIGPNDSAPEAQLRILRFSLQVVSYRKWNFRVMASSGPFLKPRPPGRDICAAPPSF